MSGTKEKMAIGKLGNKVSPDTSYISNLIGLEQSTSLLNHEKMKIITQQPNRTPKYK